MKTLNDFKIIGIDHGYGNMKTANCCFPTGVIVSDTEPMFTKGYPWRLRITALYPSRRN